MDLKMLWWIGGGVVTLVSAGWTAHEVFPTKSDVAAVKEIGAVAGYQAQFALDQQIDDLRARIERLKAIIEAKQAKGLPVRAEVEDLKYFRERLERAKAIRAGQK